MGWGGRILYVNFRRYQEDMLAAFEDERKRGHRKFHFVAPPGSGKTLIGLEIIHRLQEKAVVFVPTLALQAQWVEMSDTYSDGVRAGTRVEDDPDLLCLTYQIVSTKDADGNAHRNARAILDALAGRRTIVFDECHHLTDEWAAVVSRLDRDDSFIVGLTATPPWDRDERGIDTYLSLLGEVDYEVTLPPVVKEGYLAPFQDLVYVVAPTDSELAEIELRFAPYREALRALLAAQDFTPLHIWAQARLGDWRDPEGAPVPWPELWKERREYCLSMARFVQSQGLALPPSVPPEPEMEETPDFEDLLRVLEDYDRTELSETDSSDADGRARETARNALRAGLQSIGYILDDVGVRRAPEGIHTILGKSRSKIRALADILPAEQAAQGDDFRCLVLTDYEEGDGKDGNGAADVMRFLCSHPETARLGVVMLTGRTVLVGDDILDEFLFQARMFADQRGLDLELSSEAIEFDPEETLLSGGATGTIRSKAVSAKAAAAGRFHRVTGASAAWNTQTYVPLVTRLLERGIVRVLVSTRAMLGEGWNAVKLDTLVDLTVVSSAAFVNQMRGRTLRLDPDRPLKTSDNWDIVAVLPSADHGAFDLDRLQRKYRHFFGLTGEGHLERGIGHIHPALSPSSLRELHAARTDIGQAMLGRAANRDRARVAWKVGQPYENRVLHCLDLKIDERNAPPALAPALASKRIAKGKKYAFIVEVTAFPLATLLFLFGLLGFMFPDDLAKVLPGSVTGSVASAVAGALAVALTVLNKRVGHFVATPSVLLPYKAESRWKRYVAAVWDACADALHAIGESPDPSLHRMLSVDRRSDGSYRLSVPDANVPESASQAIAEALVDVFSPVAGQSWILKTVAPLDAGGYADAWKALVSKRAAAGYASDAKRRRKKREPSTPRDFEERDVIRSEDRVDDALVSAVPVPECFTASKEHAEAFAKAWRTRIGHARLVGSRSAEYAILLDAFRGKKHYPVHLTRRELWQ